MRLGEWLKFAGEALRGSGIENPAREARLIAELAAGMPAAASLAAPETVLGTDAKRRLDAVLARRMAREPLSRIRGTREFWGMSFALSPATLDPRPATETLVEAALERIDRRDLRQAPLRILDLGTGSGCILIALLASLPQATGLGADLSQEALSTAKDNASHHGVSARTSFIVSDWLGSVTGAFHIIVANPPYIRCSEIVELEPEVSRFDPRLALDGGEDGLEAYRKIASEAGRHLEPGGDLLLEVGQGQGDGVAALLTEAGLAGDGARIEITKDLAGLDRVVAIAAQCAPQ